MDTCFIDIKTKTGKHDAVFNFCTELQNSSENTKSRRKSSALVDVKLGVRCKRAHFTKLVKEVLRHMSRVDICWFQGAQMIMGFL